MAKSSYGYQHKRRRELLLQEAYGKPCPLCGNTMVKGMELHLDHEEPLAQNPSAVGTRIVCGPCNKSAGGRLGSQRQQMRPSRTW